MERKRGSELVSPAYRLMRYIVTDDPPLCSRDDKEQIVYNDGVIHQFMDSNNMASCGSKSRAFSPACGTMISQRPPWLGFLDTMFPVFGRSSEAHLNPSN
jgi:hypothetical protein